MSTNLITKSISLRLPFWMTVDQLDSIARIKRSTIEDYMRRNLLERPMLRTCADELAKAFNMTFDEFVEMHDGDYGIISDHCRDHLYDERRPTVQTDVCAEPACKMRVSITELNRNEGLWCDNCA